MVHAMLITPDSVDQKERKNLAEGYNAVVPTYFFFAISVTCGNNCSKILSGKFQK